MSRCRFTSLALVIGAAFCVGQNGCPCTPFLPEGDGFIALGIAGRLGEPAPFATPEQLETFERGKAVLNRRFNLADGLGPAFNLTSCGGCHERPAGGGSSALYRNFFLAGRETADGAFLVSESLGMAGGVLRVFNYDEGEPARPPIPDTTTIFAQRNAIPMFGVGLIAALDEEVILANADPDDEDGDGISGKPNFDRGFVGRFGRKAQTVSIEGFIRGPLFNHLGITTVPLTDEQRMMLPVDSSTVEGARAKFPDIPETKFFAAHQAAALDAPNFDDDDVPDPEMSSQDLFDLVSFSMLLAAPKFELFTFSAENGRRLFHEAGCSDCHIPRLDGPRGPVPAYSDFLLHDMGPDLADGIRQGEATGSEFKTQPLWGVAAVAPYLHDGRAATLPEAILMHGGEAQAARDRFAAFEAQEQADIVEFLMSLGGRDQMSEGLVPPNTPIPPVGEYGGPFRPLNMMEEAQFLRGRQVYDSDFLFAEGVGAMTGADGVPRFNGDSCRACHFDPIIGGSGPRDVNVMRHGFVDAGGNFSAPATTVNTILHKEVIVVEGHELPGVEDGINVTEHRQTPHNFGMGLVDAITQDAILANQDPMDLDGDGISGRAHILADGRLGRFGWKAQVPTIAEFVGDAMAAELGITLPVEADLSFAMTSDTDATADPELSLEQVQDVTFFLRMMAGPPRQPAADQAQVDAGEALFTDVGCAKCHIPSLPAIVEGNEVEVPLFSDLLVHEILPATTNGIVDGDAGQREFRTAPLWGLSTSAPYFHSGEADTIEEAILMHQAEADGVRSAFEALSADDRAALLAFLNTL